MSTLSTRGSSMNTFELWGSACQGSFRSNDRLVGRCPFHSLQFTVCNSASTLTYCTNYSCVCAVFVQWRYISNISDDQLNCLMFWLPVYGSFTFCFSLSLLTQLSANKLFRTMLWPCQIVSQQIHSVAKASEEPDRLKVGQNLVQLVFFCVLPAPARVLLRRLFHPLRRKVDCTTAQRRPGTRQCRNTSVPTSTRTLNCRGQQTAAVQAFTCTAQVYLHTYHSIMSAQQSFVWLWTDSCFLNGEEGKNCLLCFKKV